MFVRFHVNYGTISLPVLLLVGRISLFFPSYRIWYVLNDDNNRKRKYLSLFNYIFMPKFVQQHMRAIVDRKKKNKFPPKNFYILRLISELFWKKKIFISDLKSKFLRKKNSENLILISEHF